MYVKPGAAQKCPECSCCDQPAPVRTDTLLRARAAQGIFSEVAKYTHSRQYL